MENVFIIGAMKCGTNTLYHSLRQNPAFAVPEKKELDFFLKCNNPTSYQERFKVSPETKVLLEGTTQYSKYPGMKHVPLSIYRMNPNAKIVYLLRDPLERLESNIAHNIARGWKISIENWFGGEVWRQACNFSCYYRVASMYVRMFGSDNVYLGIFEEMIKDPSAFATEVARFAGVDRSISVPRSFKKNPRRADNGADHLSFTIEHELDAIEYIKEDIDCLQSVFCLDVDLYWNRYTRALNYAKGTN